MVGLIPDLCVFKLQIVQGKNTKHIFFLIEEQRNLTELELELPFKQLLIFTFSGTSPQGS